MKNFFVKVVTCKCLLDIHCESKKLCHFLRPITLEILNRSLPNLAQIKVWHSFFTHSVHFIPYWINNGELWSTNKEVTGAHVDAPNWSFSGDYISALRRCCTLKFLHTLQPPKMYFKSDLGRRAASCWALPHISSFVYKLS